MSAEPVTYKIIYSRRRSIGIHVSPDKGVIVRAPYRTSVRLIDQYVVSKSDWIRKHLASFTGMTRLNHNAPDMGTKILFRGKHYTLTKGKAARNSVTLNDESITVLSTDPDNLKLTSTVLESWYRKEASSHITMLMDIMIARYLHMGFRPTGLTLRSMKRRWGSCSNKGNISLNIELIKLEDRFIEYVILHELCHLRHHNHSREYYSLLSEVCPGWREIRKELRQFLT